MPLSIQSGEWQRPLMTLGIPLEVPSVELEFLVGRIVVEAHKVEKRRERKREKERADFATEVGSLSLSLSLPELLAAFGIRGNKIRWLKHNRILLTPDEEIADKITWLIRRPFSLPSLAPSLEFNTFPQCNFLRAFGIR